MQTYLFYDIETTGLNKAFDQVLEFAAIRTDLSLNEISRHEFNLQLNCDIVPSPHALITHHIGISQSLNGMPEYVAMQKIHALMNEPGTISIGYNTLGFDDEFLRFSFYRNLLTPYTHQYANQCTRMDLYPMTVFYHLYKNSVLKWPRVNDQTTFKLEHLSQANKLAIGQAHRAMVDVEATVALAKILQSEETMWDYLQGYFNKTSDQIRLNQLSFELASENTKHFEGLLIDGILGHAAARQTWGLYLGEHLIYKNQSLWLRLDTCEFAQLDEHEIIANSWVIRKKWGEPGFVLPIKDRFMQHYCPEKHQRVNRNKQWLKAHAHHFTAIIQHHRTFEYPVIPCVDVEARLYLNGFLTGEELQWCRSFHNAPLHEKSSLIDKTSNAILKNLAIRILGRLDRQVLSQQQLVQFNQYVASLKSRHEQHDIIDYRGEKKLKAHQALKEIEILRINQALTTQQLVLLAELEEYLTQRILPVESGVLA